MVELAEMGILLKEEGYRALEDDDGHPLASARIVGDDGHEADIDMITLFAKTAADNLAKSKGRATEIDARPCLHFDDYCAWQRRRAKAIVPSTLHEGLATLSWNTWIEIQGGEGRATAAGVPVERLSCPVERHHYQVCTTGAETMLDSRKQLLALMRRCQPDSEREAEGRADWQAAAESLLVELHSLREGLALLVRRYFAGQPVLFSDAAGCLDRSIATAQETAARFNSEFGKGTGTILDVEAVHLGCRKGAALAAASIADAAMAEALIEVDEQAAAMELMEGYL